MVTCQSANQLKTPAKVSWAFKMVFQFGSLGYSGRKKCGRKRCTTNRENRSLMKFVKQNRFMNLGELHKEWTEAGVKASRATTHRRVKEFGYSCHQRRLTWAKEKNWTCPVVQNPLFRWEQVLYCIWKPGPRVWRKDGEAHSPSCLKSSVKFPQSVMIWGVMSSACFGPLCFLKTNVPAPVYQEMLKHFMLPSADQLFKDVDFIFQQDLAPAHTAKSTKSWLNVQLASKLTRPVKRKMRNKRPKITDELKATVKETWASIPPQQYHKLITSMPRQIEAVIKAKGAPTKYWVHIRGLHGLKTEARTRPVPEIVWPDPTRPERHS